MSKKRLNHLLIGKEKDSMKIGLDSWIIQDGNYTDLSVGDILSFALEFFSESFVVSNDGQLSCKHLQNSHYQITARVTFKEDDLTIIDFGHYAYSESKVEAEIGQWLTGKFYIGVDPFMYFESWEKQLHVPKIKSKWRIDHIYLETTPWIEENPKRLVRDKSRFSEIEITKTNAWRDDNGRASYNLECTEIGE